MGRSWREIYKQWLDYKALDIELKKELDDIKNDETKLEDAFYQELTFGTGGIRGVLGPGTNRMNRYTVRKAIRGFADYLLEHQVNVRHRGVVIAYDSRYQSREFAEEAASVFGALEIRTFLFDSIRPTPLLSFAVRHNSAVAGIMITASHNPPEYNGLKVYNETGGQIVPEEAEKIIAAIEKIDQAFNISVKDLEDMEESKLLHWFKEEVDLAYLANLESITRMEEDEKKEAKDLKIVYTSLHGTGTALVQSGLEQLNFPYVTMVEEQNIPDPEFSTVASPNPEEHQAFTLAIEYGKKTDADILLATDPDADRLGAAVKNEKGEYIVLTGNQLGSLLLDYILRHTDTNIYRNPRMVKTVVTTELGRAIAASYGVDTIETLTGFKYIAEKISTFDASGETFLFGYEESYGYLASSFTRDKDAVQATVLTAEMANYWKSKGKTVLEALDDLYKEHGYYLEGLTSLKLEGLEGSKQIAYIMDQIRKQPAQEFAGIQAEKVEDYLASERFLVNEEKTEEIALPKENMMKFILEDHAWVCFRPSGTEPKIKYYYGVRGTSHADSQEKLNKVKAAIDEMVAGILRK